MLENFEILCFACKELIGILLGPHHTCAWIGLLHLLRDLVRRWKRHCQLFPKWKSQANHNWIILTVIASQDKIVHGLEPEEGEEVPGQAGHPSHV